MKLFNRMKRSTKQYIIVVFICIAVIGGAALLTAFIITNQIKEEYEILLKDAYREIEMNKRNVYVAAEDIVSGEAITKDKVKKATVYSSQPQESYITGEGLGKLALIDIPADTQILAAMVTDSTISAGLRETEYEVINVNSNIIDNDTVDVRIFFPNGEDYIVLSKKVIKNRAADSPGSFFWLTEEEILRMSSAIVDAYLYNGAKLYTTKYIEPELQEASLVTYEPSISTLLLIRDNPNIVDTATDELSKQVRKAMENRLAASLNTNVGEIEWELAPNNAGASFDGEETSADDSGTAEEAPAALNTEDNATYLEEVQEKEAELDYGP